MTAATLMQRVSSHDFADRVSRLADRVFKANEEDHLIALLAGSE